MFGQKIYYFFSPFDSLALSVVFSLRLFRNSKQLQWLLLGLTSHSFQLQLPKQANAWSVSKPITGEIDCISLLLSTTANWQTGNYLLFTVSIRALMCVFHIPGMWACSTHLLKLNESLTLHPDFETWLLFFPSWDFSCFLLLEDLSIISHQIKNSTSNTHHVPGWRFHRGLCSPLIW